MEYSFNQAAEVLFQNGLQQLYNVHAAFVQIRNWNVDRIHVFILCVKFRQSHSRSIWLFGQEVALLVGLIIQSVFYAYVLNRLSPICLMR